jgi:hypothetical protein
VPRNYSCFEPEARIFSHELFPNRRASPADPVVNQRPWALGTGIMRSSNMPLQAGTRLGPYEVLSLIGAGGMGEVYRAPDPTRIDR